MTAAERLADGIDSFIDTVGRITAWSSFALAAVMGANVLLRYGFTSAGPGRRNSNGTSLR